MGCFPPFLKVFAPKWPLSTGFALCNLAKKVNIYITSVRV